MARPKVPFSLAGTVPGEAVNGLFPLADDLVKDPQRLRLVVGLVDVDTIKTKVSTGDEIPVVQWRHIEVADGTAHAEAAGELLHELMMARTGQSQLLLPFTPGAHAPPPPASRGEPEDD